MAMCVNPATCHGGRTLEITLLFIRDFMLKCPLYHIQMWKHLPSPKTRSLFFKLIYKFLCLGINNGHLNTLNDNTVGVVSIGMFFFTHHQESVPASSWMKISSGENFI